jgi:hypothetical protein
MKYGSLAPTDNPLIHWSPRHDQVLALHIAGYTHEGIALATDFSIGHIRRILRDPRAERALEVLRRRMMGNVLVHVEDRLKALAPLAVDNITETIEGDFENGTKAKIHQDDVSFELLARVGFGRKELAGDKGGVQLPPEEAKRFVDAIEKANRAREIHMMPETDVEVVESGDVESPSDGRGVGGPNGREGTDQGPG